MTGMATKDNKLAVKDGLAMRCGLARKNGLAMKDDLTMKDNSLVTKDRLPNKDSSLAMKGGLIMKNNDLAMKDKLLSHSRSTAAPVLSVADELPGLLYPTTALARLGRVPHQLGHLGVQRKPSHPGAPQCKSCEFTAGIRPRASVCCQ